MNGLLLMHFILADWDYAAQVKNPVKQSHVLPFAVFAGALFT
jgi:hypothetical protein